MSATGQIQAQRLDLRDLCPILAGTGLGGSSRPIIRVTSADLPGLHGIEDFAPGLGVRLATSSDQASAGRFFAPILEHGTALHTLNWSGAPADGPSPAASSPDQGAPMSARPRADALVVMTPVLATEPPRPQAAAVLRIGMPTADCLTWAFAGDLRGPDPASQQPALRVFGLVHLGWRGLTQALHWIVARNIVDGLNLGPDQSPSFWKNAHHYLGPTIFGSDYPCGRQDVGEALLAMPRRTQALLPDAGRLRCSQAVTDAATKLAGLKDDSCAPDLQLLTLLDLLCMGADPARCIVHRINTARSANYPSYRRDERGRDPAPQPRRRLVTLFEILGRAHPGS